MLGETYSTVGHLGREIVLLMYILAVYRVDKVHSFSFEKIVFNNKILCPMEDIDSPI